MKPSTMRSHDIGSGPGDAPAVIAAGSRATLLRMLAEVTGRMSRRVTQDVGTDARCADMLCWYPGRMT
jgi:hypothetical protein